jgi:hypothetical protein
MNPYVEAHRHMQAGRVKEAEAIYVELLNTDYHNPVLAFALGMLYASAGKSGLAINLIQGAIPRMQNALDAYIRLGIIPKETTAAQRRTFVKKQISEAYNGLGVAHRYENRIGEARKCFKKALEGTPDDPDILNNMAILHLNEGTPHLGIPWCKQALEINPNHTDAKWNLGLMQLELYDFENGWVNYDEGARARVGLARTYKFPDGRTLPLWDGTPGRKVLAYGEQGIGDEILFASCLPDLIRDSEMVVFDCHKRLKTLFENSFGIKCHGTREDEWLHWVMDYDFDCRAPLGSLPKFYRRHMADFPGTPYLKADAIHLPDNGKLKVGISWEGGHKKTRKEVRSVPLERLLPILSNDCDFYSLQYTQVAEEVNAFQEKYDVAVNYHPEVYAEDYNETARLVQGLDLVISVCTSVIHLSGAMGKPCWIMVPDRPAWRYGVKGEKSPFYDSVRMFRQGKNAPWEDTIEIVAKELYAYNERWKAEKDQWVCLAT